MTFDFTEEEELQCVRVCLQNATAPYDIRYKKLLVGLQTKVGEPIPLEGQPLVMATYDLSKYGIQKLSLNITGVVKTTGILNLKDGQRNNPFHSII